MRIIKCDRCGREMDPKEYENTGYVKIVWRSMWVGKDESLNPFEDWDLCEPCIDKIIDFVRNDKEKKFEEILESADAGKKNKGGRHDQKPSIDVKKAQALRDAGWSVKKIAAELKTSEPTVRKWTHDPEPKKAKPHEWAEHEPVLGKTVYEEVDDEQVD